MSSSLEYTRQMTPPALNEAAEDIDSASDDPSDPPCEWTTAWIRYKARRVVTPVVDYCRTLWIGQQLAMQYLLADTKRHKKGFVIGVFTVFLVVLLVVSVQRAAAIEEGRACVPVVGVGADPALLHAFSCFAACWRTMSNAVRSSSGASPRPQSERMISSVHDAGDTRESVAPRVRTSNALALILARPLSCVCRC
jgi:hypothetical protein